MKSALVKVVLAIWFLLPAYASAEVAGTIVGIRGDAVRIADQVLTELNAGSNVNVGDRVETSDNGRLLIQFLDGSTLQLSGGAIIEIDDMVFDPAAVDAGRVRQALTMVEGVFRMTSGEVARINSERVEFSTPVATIGIRGTTFLGGRLTVGMPPGTDHYGFQIVDGAISVDTPGGSVVLDEPGEGTFLPFERVAAPTPVRQWTDAEEQEALDLLAF